MHWFLFSKKCWKEIPGIVVCKILHLIYLRTLFLTSYLVRKYVLKESSELNDGWGIFDVRYLCDNMYIAAIYASPNWERDCSRPTAIARLMWQWAGQCPRLVDWMADVAEVFSMSSNRCISAEMMIMNRTKLLHLIT